MVEWKALLVSESQVWVASSATATFHNHNLTALLSHFQNKRSRLVAGRSSGLSLSRQSARLLERRRARWMKSSE